MPHPTNLKTQQSTPSTIMKIDDILGHRASLTNFEKQCYRDHIL